MHKILTIDASPKQLSKLRNGHTVRIKKGTGFNLIVHPETYNLVSRAFAKNKGMEISLSPDELEMNRALSPEQHLAYKKANPEIAGQGIFGSKFDKMLSKAGVKKLAYKFGDEIKPLAKAGILAGLTSGATALGASNPALIPYLPMGVAGITNVAYDYLDNPDKYHGKSGLRQARKARTLAGQMAQSKLNQALNEELGTNYDYMGRAGLEQAAAAQASALMNKDSINTRLDQSPNPFFGYGLGVGLGAGMRSMRGGRVRPMDSIMGRGNMQVANYMNPALESQPLGANFQFQHFLPPAYQKFNGAGLYI